MHSMQDLIDMLTISSRLATLLRVPAIPCPALPEPFEPFFRQSPQPEQLSQIDSRLIPFAIVTLRNAVQQALGDALSCDRLNVVVRIDSVEKLEART